MSLKKESLKGSNNQIQCKNFANKSHKLVFKQVSVKAILGCCSKSLLHSPVVSFRFLPWDSQSPHLPEILKLLPQVLLP